MPDIQALLKQHDDPVYWEYPPDFDYVDAVRRFKTFSTALERTLGIPMFIETESSIQDASFHSEIGIPLADESHACIRFSNFGNMVSISQPDELPERVLTAITQLLATHGYTYVPVEELDTSYRGRNPGVTGIASWWIRYFDYV